MKEELVRKGTVIIGGGTIGLFLANLLVEKGIPVTIIEAGKLNSFDSFNETDYKVTGKIHSGISIGRSRGYGGTSNLWGGQLAMFAPNDFDVKKVYNQPSWPINWSEIEPYYKKVFDYLGFNEQTDECSKILFENENNEIIERLYTYWLKQPNFKSLFLKKITDSGIATILELSNVISLDFDGNKCIGVHFNGSKEGIITGFSNVVLTNGTIEISRLLLSIKEQNNCPFKENNFIGKYFQDHLNFKVATIKKPSKKFFDLFCNKIIYGQKVQPKIRFVNGNRENYLGVSGYFSYNSDIKQNLDNFKQFAKAVLGRNSQKLTTAEFFKLLIKSLRVLPQITPIIYKYIIQNKIHVPFNSQVNFIIQSQQISILESKIQLGNDSKKNDLNRALLDWNIVGKEFDEIERFCLCFKEYIEKNKLGEVVFEKWFTEEQINRNGSWINYVTDIYHHAGGAIMGENEKNSVVDSHCKLHSVDNIYIGGASIMPTSGYANTGLTSLAFAYRLSEQI